MGLDNAFSKQTVYRTQNGLSPKLTNNIHINDEGSSVSTRKGIVQITP